MDSYKIKNMSNLENMTLGYWILSSCWNESSGVKGLNVSVGQAIESLNHICDNLDPLKDLSKLSLTLLQKIVKGNNEHDNDAED